MAIHPPGQRHRYSKLLSGKKTKRDVTAVLSLTAMVDMFTVLVVFLLQNYNTTGEVLYIPKEVTLPKAQQIKELKPSVVVTISNKEILIDKTPVITYDALKAQQEWMIQPLHAQVQEALKKAKEKQEAKLQTRLREVVDAAQTVPPEELNAWSKVTVQADKGMDFLTVKKVMYTVTEAGAGEINFAVTKQKTEQ
ncbi:MAG: biopolymer transporter ExbD [Bdellovibrionaceae bacterium]|nr:biopolymer transporter ExbD [Pseudobdellovibrionaceae bacterium]